MGVSGNLWIVVKEGLRCHVGFSVVAAGGGCPPVAVFMLLMAVASLIAERRLQGAGLP